MIKPISSKRHALSLRKQGKSYSEINKILKIPKSTLSTWLKDIPMSERVKSNNINKAKLIWAHNIITYNHSRSLKYQKEKEKILQKYANDVPVLDKKALFWIGLALFWAEGGKREERSVRFVNSDPKMIKIMLEFFRKICNVTLDDYHFRMYLHDNVSEAEALKYWTDYLDVKREQFYKSQTLVSKTSKGVREINRLPYGTLHVYINNAHLTRKIKGWLRGLINKV